jgi:predicted nucleotidyltransferase
MTKGDIKRALLNNKKILKKYKVNKIGIFGSFATGRTKKKSDVDSLVEFEDMICPFERRDPTNFEKKGRPGNAGYNKTLYQTKDLERG